MYYETGHQKQILVNRKQALLCRFIVESNDKLKHICLI